MDAEETSALLRRYAGEGSGDAFAELMRRYVDLVYGAAMRRLNGDAGLAQDVVQRVFVEFAQHARKRRDEAGLGGWLYTRATRLAADIHKSESRRRAREHAAAIMAEPGTAPDADISWSTASPLLDDAIGSLSGADRDAVVLRFFENRPLRSVGAALGVSEDAAQKRLTRALEKLRRLLERRGVACTAGGLAFALSKTSASAAPAHLIRTLFRPCQITQAAAVIKGNCLPLFHALAMKPPVLIGIAALVVAGVSVPFFLNGANEQPARHDEARVQMARPQAPPPPFQRQPAIIRPGRQSPPIAVLAGVTEEERAATLKTARARAEKATQERFDEKMERLRRKLSLTPEQDARISAHHLAQRDLWIEYLTGASVGEAEPRHYHLEVSYRPDVPAALAELLSPAQKEILADHEATRRANYLEATTNGELGSLALKLDLPEPAKEALFQRLSTINGTDLFDDYRGITDLAGIARQADLDLQRRRNAFSEVLDSDQMREWESVATSYRSHLLRRFGHRESTAAASAKNPEPGAG